VKLSGVGDTIPAMTEIWIERDEPMRRCRGECEPTAGAYVHSNDCGMGLGDEERPLCKGDTITRPCPSGFCDSGSERDYSMPCTLCGGSGEIEVKLTCDPEFVRSTVPGQGHWKLTGEVTTNPERTT
jgi:hypothetical protein